MRALDLLVRHSRKSDGRVSHSVDLTPKDNSTTRRALVTGGIVAAGAAIASTAKAAITYVQLGAVNNAGSQTTKIVSSAIRALVGATNASGGRGVEGNAFGSGGIGVYGGATNGTGVRGTGANYGVKGDSTNNYGVYGTGGYTGVLGTGGPYGVYGTGSSAGVVATTSAGYGVYAQGPVGALGIGSGTGYGVWGYNSASGGYGAVGQGGYRGVYGSGGNAGVYGTSGYVGVWGVATTTSGLNYGIYASTSSSAGFAGVFSGNVFVGGTLSKTAGSFQIDHPLDPERKWLRHSFVESPDMMNVYNGNVTTNSSGVAVVKLPAYFTALNRDFRYQLTVIGKMAQAIVDQKITNNQFRIRTDQGNVEVSWQVTGIRKDDYAKAHPIVVEEAKKAYEAGGRQFVPEGSSARRIRVGPAGAGALEGAPARLPR